MSYIVLGDTHIGVKKSSKKYQDVVLTLFDRICEYAIEHKITEFIQVGDLFDNRKALTHGAIETAMAVADKISKVFDKSYLIVGNHDTSSKDTMFPHSLIIFKEHQNIHVVDKPMKVGDILMLPWLFTFDDMQVDAKICVGHFDINGAEMNSAGTVSRNHFLNFSDFSKFDLTLSGHYHTPKTYQHNVVYIGSPYQITFNDMGSNRGFYHLVPGEKEHVMNFISFNEYPHHYSYTDKVGDIGDIEGHIVRLTFTEDYGIDGNKKIIDRFRELRPYSLRIKYARLDDGMTEETIEDDIMIRSKLDILNDFHNKSDLPEGVNLVLLNKISESIYKEMQGNV